MLISTLIKRLEKIKSKYGDIDLQGTGFNCANKNCVYIGKNIAFSIAENYKTTR